MSLSAPTSVEEKNRVAMVAVMSSLSYSFCSVSMVMSNKVRAWVADERTNRGRSFLRHQGMILFTRRTCLESSSYTPIRYTRTLLTDTGKMPDTRGNSRTPNSCKCLRDGRPLPNTSKLLMKHSLFCVCRHGK